MNSIFSGPKVYVSSIHDPWWNLAVEDFLLQSLKKGESILFLWRNRPSIVIGRFQNPWLECQIDKMREDGINLVRRVSGGGTVYHDFGNLNFSFLGPKESFCREKNLELIVKTLCEFGLDIQMNARYDLLCRGKKVSGSAFRELKGKLLHHGTLLINANLENLKKYLSPQKRNLLSKGTASVRSNVLNLRDHCPQLQIPYLLSALTENFFKERGSHRGKAVILCQKNLRNVTSIQKNILKWKSWSWCFGESPQFKQDLQKEFSWGRAEGYLLAQKGIINKFFLKIDHYSGGGMQAESPNGEFSPQLLFEKLENYSKKLEGLPYGGPWVEELKNNLHPGNKKQTFCGQFMPLFEIDSWIYQEIFSS